MAALEFDASSTFGGASQSFGIGSGTNRVTAVAGDFLMQLVRLHATGPDVTLTVPSGWTAIGSAPLIVASPTGTYPNRTEYLYAFYRYHVDGENGLWTWTLNNVGSSSRLNSNMFLTRIRNEAPSGPPTLAESVTENTAGPSTTYQGPAFATTSDLRNIVHVTCRSQEAWNVSPNATYITANGFTQELSQSNSQTIVGWRTASVAGSYDMPIVPAKDDLSVSAMWLSKTFALSYAPADEWGVNVIRW